jgi:hypothetical protein
MIWNEELSASLDQSAGVVVFHRVELTRAQQLAQTVADKVGAMVEQSEKTLDLKLGGTGGWGDRADGNKGEKRGEQAQGERRGRGERTRGTRGKFINDTCDCADLTNLTCRRCTRQRFSVCTRIGKPNAWPRFAASIVLDVQIFTVSIYQCPMSRLNRVVMFQSFQCFESNPTTSIFLQFLARRISLARV